MDKPEKIMTIKEVEKNWNAMAEVYHQFDSAPQSFYFAIVNILQLQKAKNVLEAGCGRCTLLPYTLGLLGPETTYLATDLAPKMIELAQKKMKQTLSRFSCGISFEEWCKKNNVTFKVANGEEIIEPNLKFDRIICNMVLMLTENPQKMLKSFYQQAEQGCLLGVAVWGQKQLNTFHQQMTRIVDQLKVERPKVRNNFHLYNRVSQMGEKQGWKLVVSWEQISSVPYLDVESFAWYAKQMSAKMTYLTEQQRKWVQEEFMKRQRERLFGRKQAFLFPAQIIILKK